MLTITEVLTCENNTDETNKQENLIEIKINNTNVTNEQESLVKTKINNTDVTNEQESLVKTKSIKPITSSGDDIIAVETVIEEIANRNKLSRDDDIQETDTTLAISRPTTPHCDKIVPGSICRGDLEEPAETDIQYVSQVEEEVVNIPSRPVTPHSEKIVPGSISRGSMEQIPLDYEIDIVHFPVTPKSEKIVPGAICRGDLEEPPVNGKKENTKSETIPENVILEDIRPKTPIEDKIVPGSINKGMDLKEDISS